MKYYATLFSANTRRGPRTVLIRGNQSESSLISPEIGLCAEKDVYQVSKLHETFANIFVVLSNSGVSSFLCYLQLFLLAFVFSGFGMEDQSQIFKLRYGKGKSVDDGSCI